MKLHVASIKIVNGKPQIYALLLIFLEDNRQIHTCTVMEKMLTNIANSMPRNGILGDHYSLVQTNPKFKVM